MTGRLAELAQQRARLEARAGELRARERTLARQDDARRKIVVGAVVLRAVETDERARSWLVGCLRKTVAARDLHLFADLLSGRGDDA
ncbi:MAG TPA: mobilization protein [Azospirillum sp.]|nr:mobilization protein [Azospirillum sp.]